MECSVCTTTIQPDTHVSQCLSCGNTMHEQCWIKNGRCTTLGCEGKPGPVIRASMVIGATDDITVEHDAHETMIGKTCPYCQTPVKPGVAVTVCPQCEIPHHNECWKDNGGCTTFGCSGQAAQINVTPEPVIQAGYNPLPNPSYNARYEMKTTSIVLATVIGLLILIGIICTAIGSGTSSNFEDTAESSIEDVDNGYTDEQSGNGEESAYDDNSDHPQPTLDVSGIPDSCTVGESFSFEVKSTNNGTDADSGSITATFDESVEVEVIKEDSGEPRIWGAGEKIGWYNCNKGDFEKVRISASESGAEVYFRNGWDNQESKTVTFYVTPESPGNLQVQVRSTLTLTREKATQMNVARVYNCPTSENATSKTSRDYRSPFIL